MKYAKRNDDGTITVRNHLTFITYSYDEASDMLDELEMLVEDMYEERVANDTEAQQKQLQQYREDDAKIKKYLDFLEGTTREKPPEPSCQIEADEIMRKLNKYYTIEKPVEPQTDRVKEICDAVMKRVGVRMFAPYRPALDRAPHLRLINGGRTNRKEHTNVY